MTATTHWSDWKKAPPEQPIAPQNVPKTKPRAVKGQEREFNDPSPRPPQRVTFLRYGIKKQPSSPFSFPPRMQSPRAAALPPYTAEQLCLASFGPGRGLLDPWKGGKCQTLQWSALVGPPSHLLPAAALPLRVLPPPPLRDQARP